MTSNDIGKRIEDEIAAAGNPPVTDEQVKKTATKVAAFTKKYITIETGQKLQLEIFALRDKIGELQSEISRLSHDREDLLNAIDQVMEHHVLNGMEDGFEVPGDIFLHLTETREVIKLRDAQRDGGAS